MTRPPPTRNNYYNQHPSIARIKRGGSENQELTFDEALENYINDLVSEVQDETSENDESSTDSINDDGDNTDDESSTDDDSSDSDTDTDDDNTDAKASSEVTSDDTERENEVVEKSISQDDAEDAVSSKEEESESKEKAPIAKSSKKVKNKAKKTKKTTKKMKKAKTTQPKGSKKTKETKKKKSKKSRIKTKEAKKDEEQLSEVEGESSTSAADKEATPVDNKDGIENNLESDDQKDDTHSETSPSPPPLPPTPLAVLVPPPNRLYRFFLRQGRIGRTIAMILVVMMEFIHRYLPPLAKIMDFVGTLVFGPPETHPHGRRPRRHHDGEAAIAAAAAAATSIQQRTGQSKKRKKQALRQADEYALNQLKRVGNKDEAKYRHVSIDFLKRHQLGPFYDPNTQTSAAAAAAATSMDESESDSETEPQRDSLSIKEKLTSFATSQTNAGSKKQKQQQQQQQKPKRRKDEDEQNIDWVIHALTMPTQQQKKKPSRQIEDIEKLHESIIRVMTAPPPKKKNHDATDEALQQSNHVTSDRDSFVGRIRAASGSHSYMSRTLLGAYPGDVPPPNEAASPEGITHLACKYGWGEWSDEDDDGDDSWYRDHDDSDDDNNSNNSDKDGMPVIKRRRRRKVKKRKRPQNKTEVVSQKSAALGVFGLDDDEEDKSGIGSSAGLFDNDPFEKEASAPDTVNALPVVRRKTVKRKKRRKRKQPFVSEGSDAHQRRKVGINVGVGFSVGPGLEIGVNFGSSSGAKRNPRLHRRSHSHRQRTTQYHVETNPPNTSSRSEKPDSSPIREPSFILKRPSDKEDQLKRTLKPRRSLATSSVLNNNSIASPLLRDDVRRKVTMVRPAMEQLKEVRRKSGNKRDEND